MACLAARQPAKATAEFQRILDHRSIVLVDPMDAMARLQLARALALSGETVKAKGVYNDLLTLWKNADPDIRVLEQAQAGYGQITVINVIRSPPAIDAARQLCWLDRNVAQPARLLPRGLRPARAPRRVRAPRAHPSSRIARSSSFDVTPLTAWPVTLANGDCAGFATGVTAYTRPS
jgi:hypothetical protein